MFSSCRIAIAVFAALHFLACTNAAKILSISFTSSKSHKITYYPLLEELARRGHQITIVNPHPPPSKAAQNIKEIQTLDWDQLENPFGINPFNFTSESSKVPFLQVDFFKDICKKSYALPQVQALTKEKFDVVLLQPTFNECVLGMIYKMQTPLVLWSPVGVPGYIMTRVGEHFPSAIIPNIFFGLPHEMNFFQRFYNFWANAVFEVGMLKLYYDPAMASSYREFFNDSTMPGVNDIIASQTSIILSNGHFSLHHPKPLYPDVVDVGGLHSRPAKPLPKHLEDFIEKGKNHGFIYFSLGSALKASQMSEEKRKIFRNVFSQLKQQVLWKYDAESLPDLPENVMLSKWLPQQDLLGHPKINMFITHCGGGSTEEAVYHGCPLLGIPMFGDQPLNAKLAKSHGFIVELSWDEITEDTLMAAIQEILTNPQYKNNVQRLSTLFKDQPDDPLTRAVYWMEYVIRHKGAHHLRSPGRKLNYFQYHSMDVIACYVLLLTVTLYVLYIFVKVLMSKIVGIITGGKSGLVDIKNKAE